jgi:hypothetical protein
MRAHQPRQREPVRLVEVLNVVRAPSRASGAVASATALPSPFFRSMRSSPMMKSSFSVLSSRMTRSAPYARSSDCSSV